MTKRRLGERPSVRTAVAIGLALVAGGGCGPEATPQPTISVTASPLPTPVTTVYRLDATAWYAGLVIHFGTATSVVDEGGGSVAIDLQLENPGPDLASLEVPILLAAGGQAVEPVRGTVVPYVPAGSSIGTTVQFDIDSTFDLSRAGIRIGRPAEHVVIVPLVAGSQDRVTLDPVAVTLTGSATAGNLTVVLTGGELRADLPDWGLELAHDVLALRVTYTARYRGAFAGGFAFTGANLSLRLPDGTVVVARPDGHSQSVAVLPVGITVADLSARFEVPVPGTGPYELVVRDGSRKATIPFVIAAPAPEG